MLSQKLQDDLMSAYQQVHEAKRGHAAGDSDVEKQASQLASDVKYKAKGKVKDGASEEEKKKENDETIEEEDEGGDDYGSTRKIMEKEVGGNVEDGKGGVKVESENGGDVAAGDGEKEGAEEHLIEGGYEGDGLDELEAEPKMKMRKKSEI